MGSQAGICLQNKRETADPEAEEGVEAAIENVAKLRP